ncbi:MAG: DUF4838 domain-containing protein [Armatimonadetes bacterium]|nr:DUF4838 domain-containing protein [Armatimonadota bacterium]
MGPWSACVLGGVLAAAACLASEATAASSDRTLTLVSRGKSSYRIVVPETATESEQRAASELQHFIREVTGAELPIVSDRERLAPRTILLGRNRHTARLRRPIDFARLGQEGFTIRTVGNHLVIAGGPANGTLYGVYTFLEEHLGCRWLSSDVSVIPQRRDLRLAPLDDTQVPALPVREVYYQDAMDPAFAARQKLNGNGSEVRDGRLIREYHPRWGLWCHTFFNHVPPDRYFATHPEYFSLVDGKRVADGQLCLTNPDVFRLTVEDLKQRMAAAPEAHYWSVSQNDWARYCQCPECKAIDDREGTPMGSVLTFVNRIAAEFPDKTLSTLAYQYTRRPPKTLRPAKNVLIMLCSIECNRSRPIQSDPDSAAFRDDVESWARVCDNVFVWDYVVQFSNLVSPFPNLRVLQPNVRFFVDNHAKGMFAQGNRERGGEFAELRAYLLAKLLWNPDCDLNRVMNDFLEGYYGPAAPKIREYIDRMHDALEQSGKTLMIFGGPADHRDGYLSEERMAIYETLFDEAERLVQGNADQLLRVQAARLPLMYARLQLGYGTVAERRKIAERLFDIAGRTGLLMFNEWNLPTERYRAQVMEALDKAE